MLYSFGVDLTQWFPLQDGLKVLDAKNEFAKEIGKIIKTIFVMYEDKSKAAEISIISSLINIVSFVMRYTKGQNIDEVQLKRNQSNVQRLDEILEYIENNYRYNLSTKDVAQHVHLTENYFCRFFKKMTGKTFFEYLNLYRCIKAEDIMRESDKPIMDIAYEVGFKNVTYFNKVYKALRGISPGKNRRRIYHNDESKSKVSKDEENCPILLY
jgi:AraC-like DNA-binding protein